MPEKHDLSEKSENVKDAIVEVEDGDHGSRKSLLVNASGHVDELKRQYGLLSICATALTIDNAWVALGGSITIAVANGGPPGIIWEFLAACFYYTFIAASIAELASSIPSSGGVYHWASVTPGPKFGRALGFFTGLINFYGWLSGIAAISFIPANIILQIYLIFHPDFIILPWHLFLTFVLVNVFCCATIVFGNKHQPLLQSVGVFMVVVGGVVTVVVVAAMPKRHATNAFVWTDWTNNTGWSGGVAFLSGMLNGAFTIGTPDSVTHMAEELPNPRRDLPRAIFAQITLGTITGFIYVVAIMYAISDLDAVLTSNGSFPLAEVYAQATGSKGGTCGLLMIVFISVTICVMGCYITVGRIWWTLARDNVTPFSTFFSKVSTKLSCPVNATVFSWILTIAFGAISLGSKTAFADLAGSFIILTTTSYACAIFPHLLSRRSNIPKGPFWMGKFGYFVNGMAVLLIIFTNIIFCFPYFVPTDATSMNYNSVILVGWLAVTTAWWFIHGRGKYPGPKLPHLDELGKEIAENEK